MQKIVLISCVSQKNNFKSPAENLYISPLFRYNLKYAKSMNPDNIFILSAQHGLLELDKEIEPYNKTLNNMSNAERKEWASGVLNELTKRSSLENDLFVFLAGNNYRKYILEHIRHYEIPMQGLSIGRQLQFLKGKTNER
ncbi:hypothetical protein KA977_15410 [Candidatus Dependentiae bacterium]|nr:hypothetical protein [Candidatus Dependentiae bacterium]